MPIRYDGDAYNNASGTRNAFAALSNALEAEGHPAIVVLDGDREPADQLRIWYTRMTLTPGSRKVYGTAWWKGQKWYRIHPDAVGAPETSNHEKRRANDLAWPYNSNTAAHRRAQELARDFDITCEGMGFREWWHWTFWGPLGEISGGGSAAGSASTSPIQTGDPTMLLFNGITNPKQFYLAVYDGRVLKVRPTLGVEAKLLLGAQPAIPRGQLTDAEVVDLCSQGGYRYDAKRGLGVDSDGRTYKFS